MTKERVYSLLQFLRDYGILALTTLLIIISVQLCQHENHVKNVLDPAVKTNGIKIDSNQVKLKKVTLQLDSLLTEFNAMKKLHHVK